MDIRECARLRRWSSDGDSIAYVADDGVDRVSSKGGQPHRILHASGVRGIDW
jgi:Tol biopolymer transport system component